MSYLVLPSLLESGFFAEASKQMNNVCNFHVIGAYYYYLIQFVFYVYYSLYGI